MPTYKQVQDHVRQRNGFVPKTCWIAHVLSDLGMTRGAAPNRHDVRARAHPCPPGKRPAIEDALLELGAFGLRVPPGLKPTPAQTTGDLAQSSDPEQLSRGGLTTEHLSEDEVKKILVAWLEKQGWSVTVAWGQARGADCVAARGKDRWVIEAKGCGSSQPMRVNYFLAVLGGIQQRINDLETRYSIAFPDMAQFQGLWERLPHLAKERIRVTALFVSADGQVRVGT